MSDASPQNPAEVLARFQAAPVELEALLAHVPVRRLETKVYAGGWTVAEVIHHVSDGDDLWKACILAALGETVPVFGLEWYWTLPQSRWSERWHYASRPVLVSLSMFRANRSITGPLLAGTPHWWERDVVLRSRDGQLETTRLLDIVASQADHAMQHIEEIKKALAPAPGDPSCAA